MAKRTVKEERVNAERGNVPTGMTRMKITLNMGDYNSLSVETGVDGIDISSPEATERELATGEVCMRTIVKFTDNLTGEVIVNALGEEQAGEFKVNFLRLIAEAQRENGRGGKK